MWCVVAGGVVAICLLGCELRALPIPLDPPPKTDAREDHAARQDAGADQRPFEADAPDAAAKGPEDGSLGTDGAYRDSTPDRDGSAGDTRPLTPLAPETDLIAISNDQIWELTFDGRLIASRPTGLFVGEAVRGATLSGRQILHLLVGSPGAGKTALRSFNLSTGTVRERTTAGMTLPGVVGVGGVATHDAFAWVVDGATAGDGATEGLVRFDFDGGVTVRTPTPEANRFTLDVTWGADGRLHSLTSDVILTTFDPETMALLAETQLDYPPSGLPIRGVAVAQDGRVFAAAEHGQLLRFSASGTLDAKIVSSAYYLSDVDVDQKGHVVASGDDGIVVITNLDLTSALTITLPSGTSVLNEIEVVIVNP